MHIDELPTPAVVIDADVMEANLRRMADRTRAAGVALRPHAKTHKTVEIARAQLAAGARGLCLAKTSEAEAYADAGFDDLFIAYPVVGFGKPRRLLALADRVRLAVGVDSAFGAALLAGAFAEAGRTLDVLLKIDVGFHRVGVEPEQAPAVAARLAALPGVRLRGIFTHAGHGYAAPDPAAVGRDEARIMSVTAGALRSAGLPCDEVSVGATPTVAGALAEPGGLTEARPGVYVFHDFSQVTIGTCGINDCALTVLATVVSVPAPDRAVLDAGSKTLSSDPLRPRGEGFGLLLGTSSRLARLSEEHGVVAVAPGDRFRVGQRVRVLPNHCCATVNLHDRLVVVRGDEVADRWVVIGRGRVE